MMSSLISLPRYSLISFSLNSSKITPSNSIFPSTILPGSHTKRNIDSAVTDFINIATNPFDGKTIINVTELNDF